PHPLVFFYPRWEIDAHIWWQYLYPAAALTALVGLWLARGRLGRGPLAAALIFAGVLVPALGFFNVFPFRYSFVADHFQYLASIGIIVLIASVLWRLGKGAYIVLVVLGALTALRAGDFVNEQVLWEDTLEKNPRAWIAHDQLGSMALEKGDLATALGHFSQAVQIEPNHIEGYMGLSNAFRFAGNAGMAVESMRKTTEIAPNRPITHASLGATLAAVGDLNGAVAAYLEAIRVDPDFAPAHLQLADLYDFLGRPDLAAVQRQEGNRLARGWIGAASQPTTR
ncbi:MAG: tetratricopeptide repeat protein, partial [Acidobacteriota bacterium]